MHLHASRHKASADLIDFASRFPPRQLEASSPETSRPGGFEALEKIDKKSEKNRKQIVKKSLNIYGKSQKNLEKNDNQS